MSPNINDLLSKLPVDRIANQLGESPADVRRAAANALPALLMGMGANAQAREGRDSLAAALGKHDPSLTEGEVDVGAIDTEDGARIAHHVFGPREDQVVSQLGGMAGGNDLVRKLLPILAPIAMSWLAGRLRQSDTTATTSSQGGMLEQILGQVLGGGGGQSPAGGGLFGDLLGGLLGGGRR